MAKFFKYSFNREGRPLTRKLVFIGQHELEVNSGVGPEDVKIEVEGETTAFILALSRDEAVKVRRYLDKMGY